jgi:tRNA-specific 2-thiouridylase
MQKLTPHHTRVWAAMSGGVDSSTAAALLQKQGFEVEGVFMDLWDCRLSSPRGKSSCCSPRDRGDAEKVTDQLGIPLHVVDLKKAFREHVIEPFVRDYGEGRTPNPCALCNQEIKYTALLKMAREAGADFVATGHYARNVWDPETRSFRLEKGRDHRKDQSYFLFPLQQEQLARVLWPLGDMTKNDVRDLAKAWGLPVAQKGESQEICFIPDNDYRAFLEIYLPAEALKPGLVVDLNHRKLATHQGIHVFTVGQRRGLGVPWKDRLYVLQIHPQERRVVVGPEHHLFDRELELERVSWVAGKPPGEAFRAMVRIRYRHQEAPASVAVKEEGRVRICFDRNQRAITPGQAAVMYHGQQVVGGGWIVHGVQG